MNYTISEIQEFIEENDVKFVKLAFCDLLGIQKNVSITAESLPYVIEKGISVDATALNGFAKFIDTDLLLFPDLSTVTILPWRPQQGRVMRLFCTIKCPDGSQFDRDSRYILQQAINTLKEKGFRCNFGTECEFYLFETDDKGNPTKIPHDYASYCDIAPLDKGENVRRDISLTLEEMDIIPKSSHHEEGPGQNEIVFKHSKAMTAADHMITYKSVVKTISEKNGLFASFMPKPFKNRSGNGLHINISLEKNGKNIFETEDTHCAEAEFFIEGILNRMKELTIFLNPLANSYRRLGEFDAPRHITWSHNNRSRLVRIPAATGEYSRMELRSPDPTCNPYITFALLMYAGLEGIENRVPLRESIINPVDDEKLSVDCLPQSLEEAIQCAKESDFLAKVLPQDLLNNYFLLKEKESNQYKNGLSIEKEDEMYFYRT